VTARKRGTPEALVLDGGTRSVASAASTTPPRDSAKTAARRLISQAEVGIANQLQWAFMSEGVGVSEPEDKPWGYRQFGIPWDEVRLRNRGRSK
jgi:hypothetical protein